MSILTINLLFLNYIYNGEGIYIMKQDNKNKGERF